MSNAYLANIKKSGSEIQPKMVDKILKVYPDLESEIKSWEKGANATHDTTLGDPRAGYLQLIPLDAMAGYGEGEQQVMEYEAEKFLVPTFRGADFLIGVKGSSMYPKYNSGDIVACKKLSLNDVFFQWNKVYVLDTDQGALIKRVKKGSREGYITLVSDNKAYDPFEINISTQLYAIALVVGVIRQE
ncbi:MAG: S24 family peptidase [Edaphocola sp.]